VRLQMSGHPTYQDVTASSVVILARQRYTRARFGGRRPIAIQPGTRLGPMKYSQRRAPPIVDDKPDSGCSHEMEDYSNGENAMIQISAAQQCRERRNRP
jgi:hypothetical protein